jgi:hypothetical protein
VSHTNEEGGPSLANKIFIMLASESKDVALEMALFYPYTLAKEKYMDEVKVILFGPSEKLVARDKNVQKRIKRLQEIGVSISACKYCSDRMGVSDKLEKLGITVEYVSEKTAQLIKDGWASLSF